MWRNINLLLRGDLVDQNIAGSPGLRNRNSQHGSDSTDIKQIGSSTESPPPRYSSGVESELENQDSLYDATNDMFFEQFPTADIRSPTIAAIETNRSTTKPRLYPKSTRQSQDLVPVPKPLSIDQEVQGSIDCIEVQDIVYVLPFQEFEYWYDIIAKDNFKKFEEIEKEMGKSSLYALINGRFQYDVPKHLRSLSGTLACDFERPLVLAVAYHSKKVIRKMIQRNVVVTGKDRNNYNILHALIVIASIDKKNSPVYIDLYNELLSLIKPQDLKTLLESEDSDFFRPMELSAKLGCYRLFRLMFETPYNGIYKVGVAGMETYMQYDVTVYEDCVNWRRSLRSPLRSLLYLQNTNLQSFLDSEIYKNPAINKWIGYKHKRSFIFAFVWLTMRFAYLCFLLSYTPADIVCAVHWQDEVRLNASLKNVTSPCLNRGRNIFDFVEYIYIISLLIMLYDAFDILYHVVDKERRTTFKGINFATSSFVAFTFFHRINAFVLAAVYFFGRIASDPKHPDFDQNMLILKAIYVPLALTSSLQILQLLPFIGIFAITLQRMVALMVQFTVITVVVCCIYIIYFEIAAPSQGFSEIIQSIFSAFLLQGGMFNFSLNSEVYVLIANIIFYYITAILLINYLIALMSEMTNDGAEVQEITMWLRRLDITFVVEDRFARWFMKLWWMIKKKEPQVFIHAKIKQTKNTRQATTSRSEPFNTDDIVVERKPILGAQ